MIFDKISNLSRYLYVPGVSKVIDYLRDNDVLSLQVGKYDLGDECFVRVFDYVTHEEPEEVLLEAHRNYLDLQLVIKGKETFLTQAIELGEEKVPYNKEKDVEFFTAGYHNVLGLETGDFVIVCPNDLHVGNINADGEEQVKKLVFKLKI